MSHNANQKLFDAGKTGIQTRCYDSSGNITFDSGATIPTTANVYAIGALFVQNDAATPGVGLYVNVGTVASPSFVPQASVASVSMIPIPLNSTSFDAALGAHLWIPHVACTLAYATAITQTAAAGVTGTIKKVTGTGTFAAGGTNLITSTSMNFAGTLLTVQVLPVTVTAIAAYDRVGILASATPTGYVGMVVLGVYPT